MHNKLVAKVNSIDTSGVALKTKYDIDILDLENRIPNTSELVKKTDYNAKITEVEVKVPSIGGKYWWFSCKCCINCSWK